MSGFEYKVLPAPNRAKRTKGVRSPEQRFAAALQTIMNDQAHEGWDYIRSDTMPMEQRRGLISKKTVAQTVLIFRRAAQSDVLALTPDMQASGAGREGQNASAPAISPIGADADAAPLGGFTRNRERQAEQDATPDQQ